MEEVPSHSAEEGPGGGSELWGAWPWGGAEERGSGSGQAWFTIPELM